MTYSKLMLGGIGGNCSEELISMISSDQGDDVTFLEYIRSNGRIMGTLLICTTVAYQFDRLDCFVDVSSLGATWALHPV